MLNVEFLFLLVRGVLLMPAPNRGEEKVGFLFL